MSKFRISLIGVSSKYDLRNEIGGATTTYTTAMVGINNWKTSAGVMSDVNSYVFLPAVESVIDAKFEFFNSSDELVLTRNIEGIQMRINAKTTVTGSFFQSDGMDANIMVDPDWGTGINMEI